MGKVVAVVLAVAAVSLAVTKIRSLTASGGDESAWEPQREGERPREPRPGEPQTPQTPLQLPAGNLYRGRPPKVKNLLMRLAEAEKTANVEMAVSTIETLRALPGEPAADLDDALARRLGQLNVRWLFELANRQWVADVTVRPRDTASRIAAANGSTLSSLVRLNRLAGIDDIRAGQTVKVMSHPRFSLTVHRRARFADLNLNGKFFNRYDIAEGTEICPPGVYTTTQELRAQLKSLGLAFNLRALVELETLVPPNASIVVSET